MWVFKKCDWLHFSAQFLHSTEKLELWSKFAIHVAYIQRHASTRRLLKLLKMSRAETTTSFISLAYLILIFAERAISVSCGLPTKNGPQWSVQLPRSEECFGWCGSMDWVRACETKGHWFASQSDHMPRLWARSPVGSIQEATTHWCYSPPLSPPLPLSINKFWPTWRHR